MTGKHSAAVPDRARRAARTALTTAASVSATLLVIVPIVVEALEPALPKGWYLWLVGASASVLAVSQAVQRILTNEQVEAALQRWLPSLAATAPSDNV